jgi:protein TonB
MKRFTFLVLIFFGFNFSLFGQTQNEKEDEIIEINIEDSEVIKISKEEPLVCIVEQPATFEGGMEHFVNLVTTQMRFSEIMKEGRVFIQFVVNKTGKVSDIKVVKGLSEENDKEALRIMNWISEKYDWIPATQRDKNVKVRMNIPILFKREEK